MSFIMLFFFIFEWSCLGTKTYFKNNVTSQYGNTVEARQLLSEEETAQNIFRNLIYMKADISEH